MHPGPAPYVPPTLSHPDSHLPSNHDRLSSISGISRPQMAAVISQALGPWLLHLGMGPNGAARPQNQLPCPANFDSANDSARLL